MDFSRIEKFEDGIIIKDVKNFNLKETFECGQCFRWNKESDNCYIGVALNKVIKICMKKNDVYLCNVNEEDFKDYWMNYFDLKRDYGKVKKALSSDPIIKPSLSFGSGMRLLKQEPFEIIISFITSANNRIPMIKKVIENISEKCGNIIAFEGKKYYTFPTIDEMHKLSLADIAECSAGFRAKYIKETTDILYKSFHALQNNEEPNFPSIYKAEYYNNISDDECHDTLIKLPGIGPKVADCIMLFSMGKYSAFPVDVWVKRAMMHYYVAPDVSLKKIRDFGRNKFGDLSGFAQQYLFYYARENNIKI